MPLTIALLRLALSAIFAVAGITKFRDQPGTRDAVVNFGAPKAAAPLLAIILPLFELAVAVGLLFNSSMWLSAPGALLLLALFIVAISVNLARGQKHDCHCFGQLYSRPVGWPTLARNLVFAAGAAFLVAQGNVAQDSGIVSTIQQAVADWKFIEWALFGAVALAVAGLIILLPGRSPKQQAQTIDGLPVGSEAPDFELDAYDGGKLSLSQLLSVGKPLLLIFTSPTCPPCVVLFKQIREWQETHGQRLTIALITRGTIKENFVNVARNRLGYVLLQGESMLSEKYEARATPTAVLINTDGRIATPVAGGGEDIRKLLERFLADYPSSPNISRDDRKGFVKEAVRIGSLNTPSIGTDS